MGRRRSEMRCEMYTCTQSARWMVTKAAGRISMENKLACSNHIVSALNALGSYGWVEPIGGNGSGTIARREESTTDGEGAPTAPMLRSMPA